MLAGRLQCFFSSCTVLRGGRTTTSWTATLSLRSVHPWMTFWLFERTEVGWAELGRSPEVRLKSKSTTNINVHLQITLCVCAYTLSILILNKHILFNMFISAYIKLKTHRQISVLRMIEMDFGMWRHGATRSGLNVIHWCLPVHDILASTLIFKIQFRPENYYIDIVLIFGHNIIIFVSHVIEHYMNTWQ